MLGVDPTRDVIPPEWRNAHGDELSLLYYNSPLFDLETGVLNAEEAAKVAGPWECLQQGKRRQPRVSELELQKRASVDAAGRRVARGAHLRRPCRLHPSAYSHQCGGRARA